MTTDYDWPALPGGDVLVQLREAQAALSRVRALIPEWERTADECERLSSIRAGLSDARDLATAGMVNRKRAANLRAALDGSS